MEEQGFEGFAAGVEGDGELGAEEGAGEGGGGVVAEFGPVFVGDDDGVGAVGAGEIGEAADGGGVEGVVVGEGEGFNKACFANGAAEGAEEALRMADGAATDDALADEVVEREWLVVVQEAEPGVAGDGGGLTAGDGLDLCAKAGEVVLIGEFGVGEHDGLGAGERCNGLAEVARWEEAVSEGGAVGCGVDEDDVEIAGELAVLEAVIEYNTVWWI